MDKIYREYPATDSLKVIIVEGDNADECCLLKIKHTPTPDMMKGEVLLAPTELPNLLKTLTTAALDAYLRDNYLAGHADGVASTEHIAIK